jgi:hypothetical protein
MYNILLIHIHNLSEYPLVKIYKYGTFYEVLVGNKSTSLLLHIRNTESLVILSKKYNDRPKLSDLHSTSDRLHSLQKQKLKIPNETVSRDPTRSKNVVEVSRPSCPHQPAPYESRSLNNAASKTRSPHTP